ncbi:hypothetical protein H9P43_003074 [Blastocladiella emersonii ATCC 22665]|nr:hypothetical protein H9P43_003074 [Blastocladiella emersonii ATCC 22665]
MSPMWGGSAPPDLFSPKSPGLPPHPTSQQPGFASSSWTTNGPRLTVLAPPPGSASPGQSLWSPVPFSRSTHESILGPSSFLDDDFFLPDNYGTDVTMREPTPTPGAGFPTAETADPLKRLRKTSLSAAWADVQGHAGLPFLSSSSSSSANANANGHHAPAFGSGLATYSAHAPPNSHPPSRKRKLSSSSVAGPLPWGIQLPLTRQRKLSSATIASLRERIEREAHVHAMRGSSFGPSLGSSDLDSPSSHTYRALSHSPPAAAAPPPPPALLRGGGEEEARSGGGVQFTDPSSFFEHVFDDPPHQPASAGPTATTFANGTVGGEAARHHHEASPSPEATAAIHPLLAGLPLVPPLRPLPRGSPAIFLTLVDAVPVYLCLCPLPNHDAGGEEGEHHQRASYGDPKSPGRPSAAPHSLQLGGSAVPQHVVPAPAARPAAKAAAVLSPPAAIVHRAPQPVDSVKSVRKPPPLSLSSLMTSSSPGPGPASLLSPTAAPLTPRRAPADLLLMRRADDSQYVNATALLRAGGVDTERERSMILSLERGRVRVRAPPGTPRNNAAATLEGTWIPLSRARALAATCALDVRLDAFLADALPQWFPQLPALPGAGAAAAGGGEDAAAGAAAAAAPLTTWVEEEEATIAPSTTLRPKLTSAAVKGAAGRRASLGSEARATSAAAAAAAVKPAGPKAGAMPRMGSGFPSTTSTTPNATAAARRPASTTTAPAPPARQPLRLASFPRPLKAAASLGEPVLVDSKGAVVGIAPSSEPATATVTAATISPAAAIARDQLKKRKLGQRPKVIGVPSAQSFFSEAHSRRAAAAASGQRAAGPKRGAMSGGRGGRAAAAAANGTQRADGGAVSATDVDATEDESSVASSSSSSSSSSETEHDGASSATETEDDEDEPAPTPKPSAPAAPAAAAVVPRVFQRAPAPLAPASSPPLPVAVIAAAVDDEATDSDSGTESEHEAAPAAAVVVAPIKVGPLVVGPFPVVQPQAVPAPVVGTKRSRATAATKARAAPKAAAASAAPKARKKAAPAAAPAAAAPPAPAKPPARSRARQPAARPAAARASTGDTTDDDDADDDEQPPAAPAPKKRRAAPAKPAVPTPPPAGPIPPVAANGVKRATAAAAPKKAAAATAKPAVPRTTKARAAVPTVPLPPPQPVAAVPRPAMPVPNGFGRGGGGGSSTESDSETESE